MNVVIIVTDDQEIDTVNAESMPYLSSLPEGHWVTFPNSVQSTPRCGPCRANLFTAQRTTQNGVTTNSEQPVAANCINKAIFDEGVVTGLFGKYTNAYHTLTVPTGWSKWWGMKSGLGDYDGWTATSNLGGSIVEEDPTDYPGEYITDIIAQHAADFIADNAADPFLCWIATTGPHSPYTPAPRHASVPFTLSDPPDWNETPVDAPPWLAAFPAMNSTAQSTTRTKRINARRTLLAVDDLIQTVVEALDTAGVLDDTMIVFCTDNAVSLGRKRIWDEAVVSMKTTPYRYASTGLLMIRHPDATQRTDERLVDFLDLPTTFMEMFSATPIVTPAGRDLMPVILDEATTWRTVNFSTYIGADIPEIPKWRSVRTGRWRYATYYQVGDVELYDLETDPDERVNVAAANPERVALMQGWVDLLRADPFADIDIGEDGGGSGLSVLSVIKYAVGDQDFAVSLL